MPALITAFRPYSPAHCSGVRGAFPSKAALHKTISQRCGSIRSATNSTLSASPLTYSRTRSPGASSRQSPPFSGASGPGSAISSPDAFSASRAADHAGHSAMPSASASIRNILPDIRPEQTVPSKTFINMTNPGGNSGIAMRKARGMPLPLIRNISCSKKRRKKLQASFCPVMPRTRAENSPDRRRIGHSGLQGRPCGRKGRCGARAQRFPHKTQERAQRQGRSWILLPLRQHSLPSWCRSRIAC